ncbi:DUF1798 family protein [Niallia sp. Krafla_26]|uniref:DUF1798 family protein n=1 Tax=Niallia sp. Krafla_26 TaxID=3064703 RepID=UPI003D176F5D
MKNEQLKHLTEELLTFCKEILHNFEEAKEARIEGDFYRDVLPFSNRVKETLNVWEQEVMQWMKSCTPRNLNEKQIKSIKEQLEILTVQAFFPTTSKTRFIHTLHSVEYVLKTVLMEIESC